MIKQVIRDHNENISQNNRFLCSLQGKIGIKINNTVYTPKENFFSNLSSIKKPYKKHSNRMFIIWNLIAIFN